MKRIVTRFALVSLFLCGLLATGASPALASGNGAQTGGDQIKVNDCYDSGYGTTFCYTATGEYHFVATPAKGYLSYNSQANIQSECFSETDNATGNVLYHYCYANEHYQFHTNGTDIQVIRSVYTFSYTDSSGNAYCYTAQYHEANGRVQYDRLVTC